MFARWEKMRRIVTAAAAATSASGAWNRSRIASGSRQAAVIEPSDTKRVAATTRTKTRHDREHRERARERKPADRRRDALAAAESEPDREDVPEHGGEAAARASADRT